MASHRSWQTAVIEGLARKAAGWSIFAGRQRPATGAARGDCYGPWWCHGEDPGKTIGKLWEDPGKNIYFYGGVCISMLVYWRITSGFIKPWFWIDWGKNLQDNALWSNHETLNVHATSWWFLVPRYRNILYSYTRMMWVWSPHPSLLFKMSFYPGNTFWYNWHSYGKWQS